MSKDFSEKYFQPLVKKFVSSVLLVDDQLSYEKVKIEVEQLQSPVQGQITSAGSEYSLNIKNSNNEVFVPNIVKSFSEEGYLLTAINPKDYSEYAMEEFKEIFKTLAEKSDVIILDWEMDLTFSDGISFSGESFTKEILPFLNTDNRYRLVYIYTKELDKKIIEKDIPNPPNIEIKIYQKTISPLDLAKQIKIDFLSKASGIMTAELLQSLHLIRKSTYEIFYSLDKDFDEALMYHRILLSEPDKINDFKQNLISDEILSYLEQPKQDDLLSAEVFMEYMDENNKSIQLHRKLDEENLTDISTDDIKNLLCKGYTGFFEKDEQDLISSSSQLAYFFPETEKESMKKFSMYSTMLNKKILPHLKLGCVVKENKNYLLCIQPPCDSERISKIRNTGKCNNPQSFIFLKLEKSNTTIDFYIKESDKFQGLRIKYKDIRVFNFAGDEKGVVSLNNGKYDCYPNTQSLTYICCLKPMFAQKIANKFAANISRVGIDQFEWLRLKSRDN